MIHWGFHRWLFLFWLFLILKTSQCLLICVIQYLCALISTAIRDLVNTQTCYGSSFCPPQITVDLSSLLGYDFEIGHEIEISRLKYFVPSFCYGGLVVISALRLMPHVFFWEAQHMEDFFCMNVELAQHSQLKISHGQNDCFCLNCAVGFQHRYKSWLSNFAPGSISEVLRRGHLHEDCWWKSPFRLCIDAPDIKKPHRLRSTKTSPLLMATPRQNDLLTTWEPWF